MKGKIICKRIGQDGGEREGAGDLVQQDGEEDEEAQAALLRGGAEREAERRADGELLGEDREGGDILVVDRFSWLNGRQATTVVTHLYLI